MATVTPAEARRLDLNAEELGVSVAQLMRNAGRALAAELARQARAHPVPRSAPAGTPQVVLLCGKGNNGGDGAAAAVELERLGVSSLVVLVAGRIRGPGAAFLAQLPRGGTVRWTRRPDARLQHAPVVADCLLGSGQVGVPRGELAAAVRWINARRTSRGTAAARVVACDVPSGFGTRVAVQPHVTVTFHAPKTGMPAPAATRDGVGPCGLLRVAPIGIPRKAETHIGVGDLDAGYVRPAWDSHKGDNGIVLVVGGSVPLTGAPWYVACGALRAGADLVHVAACDGVADVLRAYGPGPIVHSVCGGGELHRDAADNVAELLPRAGALVIGPGLGTSKRTRAAVARILEAAADKGIPCVVDADALDALSSGLLQRHGSKMVLTPHTREFQDLAGAAATQRNVVAYAAQHGVTVLRKAAVDVVTDGQRTRLCDRGHPTLTGGGTGDVLAGIVGALMAKGAPAFEAACAGSYLLKCAGEVAASLRSYGAVADDIAQSVPAILLRLP